MLLQLSSREECVHERCRSAFGVRSDDLPEAAARGEARSIIEGYLSKNKLRTSEIPFTFRLTAAGRRMGGLSWDG
jgi:hypothetical protein